MIRWTDTGNVHGVAFIVPRVERMGASGNCVNLDGLAVDLVILEGVEVHRLKHLLLQAHATAGCIFVSRSE